MCIRDSRHSGDFFGCGLFVGERRRRQPSRQPVSYTHLVRVEVETALAERKAALEAAELAAAIDAAAVDVTLPGRAQQIGTRHLINGIIDEISEIFLGLGYSVAQGPEVET